MNVVLPPQADDQQPLFIVGSMRSGSTWVRDLLRRIPNFICPEETHFLRWSEPFRTPGGMRPHTRNRLLERHRDIDGIDPEVFDLMLRLCPSKAHLHKRYISAYAQAQGVAPPFRWFDKTPQNIYGLPLILAEFPKARILHLVRNPLNVVASLKLGKQVKIPDLQGAINCWLEAVMIWDVMSPIAADRVMELRYEEVLKNVPRAMSAVAEFAGVNCPTGLWSGADARQERNQWTKVLNMDEAGRVVRRCAPAAALRGYDLPAMLEAHMARDSPQSARRG
ncbi:MAG: sulfotransferase [Roseicyclus sp.]|nr:sulfotransferase [Roseicyclus sp.]